MTNNPLKSCDIKVKMSFKWYKYLKIVLQYSNIVNVLSCPSPLDGRNGNKLINVSTANFTFPALFEPVLLLLRVSSFTALAVDFLLTWHKTLAMSHVIDKA